MYMHPEIDRDQMTPQQAIEILQQGNERFVNNVKRQHDMLSVRDELKDKQHPFASILSCSDSRTTVELIFDQNLGDIFSVRLAGNVASTLAIGSLEFSTEYLGSKLVVVMGHSNCGAVKAACDHFKGGNIGEIINMIDPAVSLETTVSSDRNSSNTSFVDKVCWHNVHEQINNIKQHSKIINQMVIDNQIALVGAVYDLASGSVQFDI
ncbi:MAG: carbonic anhydrase [Betaproteobacteria bacterium]|nr:carbonic anhydrase [Nitrosomonadales bacterium]NCV54534.1 carbonic anhydrase [Betaproteobacteria bacterium]